MERFPMMPKPALADWKKREREECSSRVYQLPMTRTKPGLMVHSKNPWRARRIMRWVQFCAAPMQVTQTPGCEEEERLGQFGFSLFFLPLLLLLLLLPAIKCACSFFLLPIKVKEEKRRAERKKKKTYPNKTYKSTTTVPTTISATKNYSETLQSYK